MTIIFNQETYIVEPYLNEYTISKKEYQQYKFYHRGKDYIYSNGMFYNLKISRRSINSENRQYKFENYNHFSMGDKVKLPHGVFKITDKVLLPNSDIEYKVESYEEAVENYFEMHRELKEQVEERKQVLREQQQNSCSLVEWFKKLRL